MEKERKGRKHGGGNMEEESWSRDHGTLIMGDEYNAGGIMEEESGRHLEPSRGMWGQYGCIRRHGEASGGI